MRGLESYSEYPTRFLLTVITKENHICCPFRCAFVPCSSLFRRGIEAGPFQGTGVSDLPPRANQSDIHNFTTTLLVEAVSPCLSKRF